MIINGKVHCFFEQSGTFKNELIKLGIPAEDYDIQNNFGETDHVIDLFGEIEKAYEGGVSIFDTITCDDLIIAFFPCIYFCDASRLCFSLSYYNYKHLTKHEAYSAIIQRAHDREKFFRLLLMMFCVVEDKKLRMVVENPYNGTHYLKTTFEAPQLIDHNRMLRGDYFVKPTAYWFVNCEPTWGKTIQKDKKQKRIKNVNGSKQAGICSEERSMISPDYARNFICDFILGRVQNNTQLSLFNGDKK